MNDFPDEYKPVIAEIKRRGYKDPYFILRLARLIREWLEQMREENKKINPAPHVCCGCGGVGKYQKKNGNWYCALPSSCCPGIAAKIRESHKRRLKKDEK